MSAPTSENPQHAQAGQNQIDRAVAQGGAYEVLRKRLGEQGHRLSAIADALNAQRLHEFGDSRMEVIGRLRIRTENNCIGRDIVQVGDLLLFGYNVFMGMKTRTKVEDVFGLYQLVEAADGFDVKPVDLSGSFLGQAGFVRDFDELYAYYKNAKLLQLKVLNSRLLAAFQIGERSTDMRVFRWSISNGGELTYLDSRGEQDIALPEPFDFDWIRATREMVVNGRFPHLNILDTLFVETTGGDLTIKVESNTESGQGIYSEPVEDQTQSLDDAVFDFARVGTLVLVKILPYRETQWRGLIYNTLTRKVLRNDAIVQACVQLPEDHGIIFPGGYYLQNGEHKAFDASMEGMRFRRMMRSPNGEDVMYVFYEHEAGKLALFGYNMIQRKLQNPVFGHGYARLADGRMVIFHAEGDEPTRIHPMQVWQTPFSSEEFAAGVSPGTSFMGKIGNPELVRGISNLYSLCREIESREVSIQRYQLLTHNTRRMFDAHHWLDDEHCGGLATLLHEVSATGEAMLDEYEKVQSIRQQSDKTMAEARSAHLSLRKRLLPENWTGIQEFVDALNAIAASRGHLLTIREYRYIDTDSIDAMGTELQAEFDRIGAATGRFLAGDTALLPFAQRLQTLDERSQQSTTATQLAEQIHAMQAMSADLDVLSELMAGLKVEDATERTRVVEAVSAIYARLNQTKARADQKRKVLGSSEAVARFGAQFTLFSQSITSALGLATDPERADEQLSRLMVQLEELESQFGEHEQFLDDILGKREELLETFESHKQALLDERQRKAQSVLDAANRILEGLGRRTERFDSADELNAFFVGDPLVLKLRELVERLRSLKDSVKADDVEARIKGARDQSIRALRDRSDLFEDGGSIIKLGPRHRFSVNTQPLDLTLLPRQDGLALHLTGTDFLEPIHSPALAELREYWQVGLESESPQLYRGEYLAGQMMEAADRGLDGLSQEQLYRDLRDTESLAKSVRDFAAPRYRDGYERGIHDHDAALILQSLLLLRQKAGPLVHPPEARALATLFWLQRHSHASVQEWRNRFLSARKLQQVFDADQGVDELVGELATLIEAFVAEEELPFVAVAAGSAAHYLGELEMEHEAVFVFSQEAVRLVARLKDRMEAAGLRGHLEQTLEALKANLAARWSMALHWMEGLCREPAFASSAMLAPEAAVLLLIDPMFRHEVSDAAISTTITGLLGEHPRITQGAMPLSVDDALSRLHQHRTRFVPGFHSYQALRQQTIAHERHALRLSEFTPRPLSSFVRNRLINDTHLPIVGDNLAKQMGTVGENKRSDLMGLLMLISPPGYGKTTLMEYVAHRLGLIFMKINGPALGHEVRSLDPAQAPDATSRQELEKLNLALEMGNNVMLYLDDIQHTHPEFLQKFISLCDGTRRIEGVWKGKTRTYDMRGKKFCVVMAGNPYTESGEVFKIPDMLANRADIYNLGDVLGGIQETFALSYLENCLTSNTVLAPLATRDLADLYVLADKAGGKEVSTNALSHAYSGAEINEIVATLQRLMRVRNVVFRVNQQYIASAAQADRYRTEPPFKLQGSYRNMNKLAEKVSPAMNEVELQQLVSDHYQGESQLLTSGAEENLLKLAEIRDTLDAGQKARWEQIKRDFLRNKAMGAEDADVGGRVVAQLADIAGGLQAMRPADGPGIAAEEKAPWQDILAVLGRIAGEPDARTATAMAEALPASVHAALTPLLEILREGHQQQGKINEAMLHLADAIRAGIGAQPTKPEGRKAGKQTPEQRRLEEALEVMQFGKNKPA